ncbi:MAG TPA: hypothetical protein VF174_08830 [Micromonosporaceae bacterium]
MPITRPTYATREMVQRAADIKKAAYTSAQIDRALESASESVEGILHRHFYPLTATRYFDWPNFQYARPWRIWFDQHDCVSLSSFTAGGTTVASTDYFLRPDHGPPFTHLEIDLESSASLSAGATHQRALAGTGVWAYDSNTTPAGILAEALDLSETAVDISDASLIGVGDVILVETERMLVTNKTMRDTGVNIDSGDSLTAAASDVGITVSSATNMPTVDEVILIDSERMLVVDVSGTLMTVKRAYDGTVLATHAANADIYALRTLTVTRGALGTTAATHADTTAITRHVYPALVRDFTLAMALDQLTQESSGYARGAGESAREQLGTGLDGLRKRAEQAHGRKARSRAV